MNKLYSLLTKFLLPKKGKKRSPYSGAVMQPQKTVMVQTPKITLNQSGMNLPSYCFWIIGLANGASKSFCSWFKSTRLC